MTGGHDPRDAPERDPCGVSSLPEAAEDVDGAHEGSGSISSGEEAPWEPAPIPEEAFLGEDGWININRAPLDRVSGVIYKRAANIKRVCYEPVNPAPEMLASWQGEGAGVVRWLFSEVPGMEEGLLAGRTFAFMQDLRLASGASTGHRAHPDYDTLLYVVGGRGMIYHRSSTGSPVVARPLRPGDVVLVEATELYSLAHTGAAEPLRLIVVGLREET
jgi:mannose-6-phosphate isomerase-like protein (cupin superfamily)